MLFLKCLVVQPCYYFDAPRIERSLGYPFRPFGTSWAPQRGLDDLFRSRYLVGVRFEGAILTGAIGLPTGGPAEQSEGSKKMPRARPSGLRLSETQASIVKGMLQRGDRQHDIAGWFAKTSAPYAKLNIGFARFYK
jgi:hypothetical protein